MSTMSHLKKIISYINQRRNKKKSTLEMNILGLAKSWSTFIFFLSKGVNFCFDFLFVSYHNHWEIFHTKSQIQVSSHHDYHQSCSRLLLCFFFNWGIVLGNELEHMYEAAPKWVARHYVFFFHSMYFYKYVRS